MATPSITDNIVIKTPKSVDSIDDIEQERVWAIEEAWAEIDAI